MKKFLFFGRVLPLVAMMGLMALMGSNAQAQKIIDTWSFDTGVDTTQWYNIDGVDSVIIGPNQPFARSGLVPIGFPFHLGPLTVSKFSTNTNGTIHFGNTLIDQPWGNNKPFKNENMEYNYPKVEAFGWCGDFDANSYARYALLGDSGSRVLVIEIRMTGQYWASGKYCSFQVQLFETGGLRMVFGDSDDDAISGAAQMQNGIGVTTNADKDVIFIDYSTHEAVRWDWLTYYNRTNSAWPEKGRWYMVAPDSNYCPYPPYVSVTNQDPANITLHTNYTNQVDMQVRIPAAGVDTLWPKELADFLITTSLNPGVHYVGTLQGVCDSGKMSYCLRDVDIYSSCGSVVSLPWNVEFNYISCWDLSQYTSDNNRWNRTTTGVNMSDAIRCGATTTQTYNEWLITPVINLPDTNGITMKWLYWAKLLNDVAPYVEVRIAPCDVDGTVDSAAWTTVLTLNHGVANLTDPATQRYVNLDTWSGQRVRVAFVRTGTGGGYAAVGKISFYLQHEPVMAFDAPTVAHVGDSTVLVATMSAGVDSNVMWEWHSTLLDSTWYEDGFNSTNGVNGQCVASIVYPAIGFDTVTVVLTTAYGTDTVTAALDVVDCRTITSFPWSEDFQHSTDCWVVDGWKRYNGYGIMAYNETGNSEVYSQVVYATTTGNYMITPPIVIPTTGVENLSFWIECDPALMVCLSPTAGTNPLDFTDTLLTIPAIGSQNTMLWYAADLEPYAGQTVRVGLFKINGGSGAYVNTVKIDYDTLPRLMNLSAPDKAITDSTFVYTASLRRGSTEGLTFTWHSSLMGDLVSQSSSLNTQCSVNYTLGGIDTVSVIASNIYGSDTLWTTVNVKDCNPATTLPWKEDFQHGTVCWYIPEGSNWRGAIPYNQSYYEHMRHLGSDCNSDTINSWIMSKAIDIPSDTNELVRLFWKVASSYSTFVHTYRVMVTTSSLYTDTSVYETLYFDSTAHSPFSNYDIQSVSLAQYAGQTIHLAFNNRPVNYNGRNVQLYIDDVEIRSTAIPRLTLVSDAAEYYYGDTATFTATLDEGSPNGLTYQWHSTLLDTTMTAGDTLRLCYGMLDGSDTVSVIATNAFGSGMAQIIVNSYIITRPHVMDFDAEGMSFFMDEDNAEVGDTVTYQITRNACVTTGLTYTLHSTLLDTTVTVVTTDDVCRIPLIYTEAGIDSLTAIIFNAYDTSYSYSLLLTVRECTVASVPFFEDFDNMGEAYGDIPCWPGYCWLYPFGDESNLGASFRGVGAHEYLITPAIDLPADTLGLQLSWFTYFGSNYHTYLPARILVSPTGSKDIADFTETLFYGNVPVDAYDTLSLDAYRGQRIRLAFGYSGYQLVFDDIRIDYDRSVPQVEVFYPDSLGTLDTILFTASLTAGAPQDLTFSWHSTLGTVTGSGDSVYIYYPAAGTDTLTVIATTAYGADTVTLLLQVNDHPLPQITQLVGANSQVEVGNEFVCSATSNWCSANGLYMTAHSSLLDTSFTEYGVRSMGFETVYDVAGVDTITFIVANLYGADTAIAVVNILDCSSMPLPYYENFEGVTATSYTVAGFLPSCWFSTWYGSNAAVAPHVITTGGYQWLSNIPDNALLMIAGSATGYTTQASVRLPRFADSIQHLSLAFDYRFETASNGTLSVGYYDDNDVFTALQTLAGHSGDYLRDTISFISVSNPSVRMALRWEYYSSWYGVAIDNIEVFTDSRIPAPDTVTVDNMGDTYARVTWSEVSGAEAYRVVITGVIDTIINSSSVFSLNLTGLTPSTQYAVHVAGIVDGETGHFASAQFTTPCSVLYLPFTTDFSDVAANTLPVCWTYQWVGTAAGTPQVNADGNLQMGAGGYYNGDYRRDCNLTLPYTDAPLNSAMFAIQYHCQNPGYGTLNVGYMNGNSFVSMASLPNQGTTVRRDTLNLYNFPEGVNQLTLNWHGDYYGPYYIYIHELSIFNDGAIRTPRNLHVESVSGQCVSLAWNPVDSASAYHVTLAGVIDTVVTDTTVSFCGLTSNTQYTVNVAGMTADDTGRYAHLTFTTACSIIGLPWFENFQGSNPLQCWTEKDPNVYAGIQVCNEYYWEPFCHSGSRGLQIYNYSTRDIYVASPVIEEAPSQLLVSFWISDAGETNGIVEAGVMTDPNDSTTFIPLMQCQLSETPTRYEFDTRNVSALNYVSIAFRTHANSHAILVDDITVEHLTSCARLRAVSSYSIDAHTAVVNWQYDTASAIPNTGALVTLTDLTDSSAAPITITDTSSSHTFTGLVHGHRYQASVQALCAGDTTVALTTLVIPSGNVCAERRGNMSSGWFLTNVDRPYSYSQTLYPSTLAASVDTLYGIAYRIVSSSVEQYPGSYDTYSDGPRMVDIYIGQTTANTLTSPVSASNLTLAVQNYELPLTDTGWVRINFTTPVPLDGVSNLIVTFDDNTGAVYGDAAFGHHIEDVSTCFYSSSSSYSYTQTYDPYNPSSFNVNSAAGTIGVPDIQLLGGCSSDRCLQPIVTITAEDTHSVSLSWSQRGSELLWLVEYKIEGDSLWIIADTTANTFFTITGLNASTAYKVRVSTLCAGEVIPSDVHRVHTLCGAVNVPYYQTFRADYMPTGTTNLQGAVPCWETGNIGLLSQGRGLWNTNQNGDYIISPEIGSNLSALQVRFTVSGSTFFLAGIKVGACAADGTDLQWLDTVTLADDAQEYTVYLTGYDGGERHIAIGGSWESWTLYDVAVEAIDGCQPVHHVSLSWIGDTSATIHWPAVDTASNWAVYIDDSLAGVTHDTLFAFGNLIPGTTYTLGVREICWPGDTAVVTTLNITTLCSAFLPWTENFDGGVYQELPACWYPHFRSSTGYIGKAFILTSSGNPYLRFYDSYSPYNEHDRDTIANFLVSPMLYVDGDSIEVNFYSASMSSQGVLQAGIITNPADTSTFIPMLTIPAHSGGAHYRFTTTGHTLPAKYALAFRAWGDMHGDVDSIHIDLLQPVTYSVTLAVNDTVMGTVIGAGVYIEGTSAVIEAVANEGYHFVVWSDSVLTATREVVVSSDLSLTAFFAVDTVWRTVTVTANVDAVCEPFGSGRYMDGDTVEIGYNVLDTMTIGGHWNYLGWSDGETGNPRQIVVTSDTLIVALFQWVNDTIPTPDTIWRTVTVLCDNGIGEVNGGGTYMDSSWVTLSAVPLSPSTTGRHIEFDRWSDGNTDNPRQVFVTSDTTFTALFRVIEDSVAVPEVPLLISHFSVYPNPARSLVTVAVEAQDAVTVMLLDMNGRAVTKEVEVREKATLDVATLPRGVYFVRIASGEAMAVKKLVLE